MTWCSQLPEPTRCCSVSSPGRRDAGEYLRASLASGGFAEAKFMPTSPLLAQTSAKLVPF